WGELVVGLICLVTIFIPSTMAFLFCTLTERIFPVLPLSSPAITLTVSPVLTCSLGCLLNFLTIIKVLQGPMIRSSYTVFPSTPWLQGQKYGYLLARCFGSGERQHYLQTGYRNRPSFLFLSLF